jgi:hypothetical protein
MILNHELWLDEFRGALSITDRWDGFVHLTRNLCRKARGVIIETGCIRATEDWKGAGQSTMVWDWLAEKSKLAFEVYTCNNDPAAVQICEKLCKSVNIEHSDSLAWLTSPAMSEPLSQCDLLYLDSMDHNPPYGESELHAVGELAIAWPELPKGCLIAVDDCNGDGTGKHYLIRHFFDRLHIKPELKGYITIWRKP